MTSLLFNEMYVLCESCGEYNEHMPAISEGKIEEIQPAESVIGQWDGRKLDNTYLWYSNFLHLLGDDNAAKALVMDVAKKYFDIGDFEKIKSLK
ncbi:MAG: hypothetical protein IJA27_07085 [Lachnospiraceae bacterium]|nr:hypothetical protein [Lachnospiraceae bacterium]